MTRSYTESHELKKPSIDKRSVEKFFSERAAKISEIGSVRAVIYQDKNSDLAQRRDSAEKLKLLPLFKIEAGARILDVGCGTGRWARELIPLISWYHGIDFCAEFIAYSADNFKKKSNAKFTVSAASNFSLASLGETKNFDRVLCAGVLLYMEDAEVLQSVRCMFGVMSSGGRLLIREPLGVDHRLTLVDHYSNDMDQNYSAIYRTSTELLLLIKQAISESNYVVIDGGDVFDDLTLNNRQDTKQQWLILEKK